MSDKLNLICGVEFSNQQLDALDEDLLSDEMRWDLDPPQREDHETDYVSLR